jgi:hypothetical protein
MARVGEVIAGRPVPPEARAALEARARQEGRVVLRVTPERLSRHHRGPSSNNAPDRGIV